MDAGRHGYKATEYRTSLSAIFSVCNVLRESLSEDSQNIPCATQKRKGVVALWVISGLNRKYSFDEIQAVLRIPIRDPVLF
jgi:hypothetical protein